MGSTVALQCKDQWRHGLIEDANSIDHNGITYIIEVTKMGRLITCKLRHIYSTAITMEWYLQEQIKKGTGCLEDIFMDMLS